MNRQMSAKEARRVCVMQQVGKKILTLRGKNTELDFPLSQAKKIRLVKEIKSPKLLS